MTSHRRPSVAKPIKVGGAGAVAAERLRGVALGEIEDDVLGEPRDGGGGVAEQRQSGDDEDRQRHGEQHDVAIADQGRSMRRPLSGALAEVPKASVDKREPSDDPAEQPSQADRDSKPGPSNRARLAPPPTSPPPP